MNLRGLVGFTALLLVASPALADGPSSTSLAQPAASELDRFAGTQLKEFAQLRRDFESTMADRLTVDINARHQLRQLDLAIETLRHSLKADEAHPTNFTSTELKSDLFVAQEAAQNLLEMGVSKELASAR